jgi:hypothetical protein
MITREKMMSLNPKILTQEVDAYLKKLNQQLDVNEVIMAKMKAEYTSPNIESSLMQHINTIVRASIRVELGQPAVIAPVTPTLARAKRARRQFA